MYLTTGDVRRRLELRCRDCFHCIKTAHKLTDDSYWCRFRQKTIYPGTYGRGYRRGRGIIYLDYNHDWECWTEKPINKFLNAQ